MIKQMTPEELKNLILHGNKEIIKEDAISFLKKLRLKLKDI